MTAIVPLRRTVPFAAEGRRLTTHRLACTAHLARDATTGADIAQTQVLAFCTNYWRAGGGA